MSMSIKNGKLIKTYETVKAPSQRDSELEEEENVDDGTSTPSVSDGHLQGAFSNNPLLADGKLSRPIWKAPDGEKGKGREVTTRQSKWRRVQDDDEDNEQWILDGGIHGHNEQYDDGRKE